MKNLRLAIVEIINGGVEEYAECCHGLILADEIIALLETRGIAIADRNPSGGDVKQAPSRSDESGGAATQQSHNTSPTTQSTD